MIGNNGDAKYIVVVGPSGCGKTTAVQMACRDKQGVIKIRVDKPNVNVYELIAKKFKVKSSYYKPDDLVKFFEKTFAKMCGNWVPTIVVEVERGAKRETIQEISTALKVGLLIGGMLITAPALSTK